MGVPDTVAIEVVLEARAECTDRARAEAALSQALANARAPRRARSGTMPWHLEIGVSSGTRGVRIADAAIRDDAGHPVATRSISDRTSGTCVALAQAISAWTQMVLDDELSRSEQEARSLQPSNAAKSADARDAARDDSTRSLAQPPANEPNSTQDSVEDRPVEGNPSLPPRDAADQTAPRPSDVKPRTVEVGTMLLIRNGVASTGGIFGASPYVGIAFAETWVLRPALLVGTSTSPVPSNEVTPVNLTFIGTRVDFCRRLPGNYLDRRGIEFDACAGGDVAYVGSSHKDVVRGSLGPSAILRGELGSNFGLEIRGLFGANLARAGLGDDAPFFVAAAEVGGSVRFR